MLQRPIATAVHPVEDHTPHFEKHWSKNTNQSDERSLFVLSFVWLISKQSRPPWCWFHCSQCKYDSVINRSPLQKNKNPQSLLSQHAPARPLSPLPVQLSAGLVAALQHICDWPDGCGSLQAGAAVTLTKIWLNLRLRCSSVIENKTRMRKTVAGWKSSVTQTPHHRWRRNPRLSLKGQWFLLMCLFNRSA